MNIDTAALLVRHHAGLPGLLIQFLRGSAKRGPILSATHAEKIVTKTFGRADVATYGAIRTVKADDLARRVEEISGIDMATAQAESFLGSLGQLTITQPLCENGHLPILFTGPVSFKFLGSDTQCPVCKSRVLDPDPKEFLLIWSEDRLGHPAEIEVTGDDGQLYRQDIDGLTEMVGRLHPWFQLTQDMPQIDEIALTLKKGTGDGKVEGLKRDDKVIDALSNPTSVGLKQWHCETVARAARGAYGRACNPFLVDVAPPPKKKEKKEKAEPSKNRIPLARALELFSVNELHNLTRNYGEITYISTAVAWGNPAATVVTDVIDAIRRSGLEDEIRKAMQIERPRVENIY